MRKKYIGKTCPYCKTPLVEGDTVVFCSVCDMPHHLSCWQDNQGCTTFGCTGSIKEIIGNDSVAAAAPAAPQPTPAPVAAPKPIEAVPAKPVPAPAQAEQAKKPLETLYESKEMVFMSDVPIVLENTALIIDRTKGKLFARCTFRSITDKAIKAVLIEISCQDVWGSTLGEPVAFQYLDLQTKRDSKFGQTNPVELPDKTTRKIQVTVKKVLFADDSVVSGGGAAFTMPAPIPLSKHLGSDALAAEYARETSPKAQFVPADGSHYWLCACGALNENTEEKCCNCGCTKEQLMMALDPDVLQANMISFAAEKKAAADKAQAEQAERIRQAEEQVRLEQEKKEREIKLAENLEKSRKRRKKTVKAIIVSLIVIAVVGCGTIFFGIPYFNYRAACDALDNGEYDTAYQAFVALGNFMDSEEMANQSLYEKAEAALDNGEYDAAYQAFVALGNFMDSEEMANKSLYEKGKALLKEEKFDQAISVFEEIEDYEDSAEMITESQYLKACDYLERKNYIQAISIFEDISYYKNSADKIKEAKYGYVLAHKNNDDTTTYDYLLSLKSAGYKDASTIYKDLYSWKVTGVCNTDSNNYTKHESSVSKYCSYLHFRFKITGGTPGEKINLTHTTIYPDGEKNVSDWHWENEYDGSSFGCEWDDGIYTYPAYSDTGTLTIKVYNLDTGELLGTVSTRITN